MFLRLVLVQGGERIISTEIDWKDLAIQDFFIKHT